MTSYFTPDFYAFFKELASNNHKEWMDENRKRYHDSVKTPFENFIKNLQEAISGFDEPILEKPNKAIFRINRDIRFSKDKTPYKVNRSAIMSKYGRSNKEYPGFYISIGPENCFIGGGAYQLSTENIYKVRQEISYNLDEFQSIISAKDFVKNFGEIKGEKAKRIPKEFAGDIAKQPLIANKSFFFMEAFDASLIFDPNIISILSEKYKTAKPLNDFLRRAIYD